MSKNVKTKKVLAKHAFSKRMWRECSEIQKNAKKFVTITFSDFWSAFFLGILQMIPKKCQKNAEFLDHAFYDEIWCVIGFVVHFDSLDDTQMIPKKNATPQMLQNDVLQWDTTQHKAVKRCFIKKLKT